MNEKKNEEQEQKYARRLQSDVERAIDSQPTEAERHSMWQKCSETVFCEYFVKRLVKSGCKVVIDKDGNRMLLEDLAGKVIWEDVTKICGTWGHPDWDDKITIKNPFRTELFTEPCACHIPDPNKDEEK